MLQANELMIGDWVKISHLNKIGKVYRIDRANGKGNGFVAVIDCDYNERNLEPIPLTEEILEKNGFKEDKYGQMVLDEELGASEIYFILQDGDEDYWWVVGGEPITKIKYVHQLQHAMRLCGIEKEIML